MAEMCFRTATLVTHNTKSLELFVGVVEGSHPVAIGGPTASRVWRCWRYIAPLPNVSVVIKFQDIESPTRCISRM